jgi:predicted RNA-binding protein with TRAM domain
MRKGFRFGAFMAIVAVATSAATAAPQPSKRHYRLSVDASVYSWYSHGDDKKRDRIGDHTYHANFQYQAVVLFEPGKKVEMRLVGGAYVAGSVRIEDNRQKPASFRDSPRRWIPVCPGWSGDKRVQIKKTGVYVRGDPEYEKQYVFVPGTSVGVDPRKRTFRVNPNLATWASWGCGVHDNLKNHDLQSGPSVTVVAPTFAKLVEGQALSLQCVDKASHDASHPHSVEYRGEVAVSIYLWTDEISTVLEDHKGFKESYSTSAHKQHGNEGESCSKGSDTW